ncbi:glycoside hydrolase family protein [Clostridium chromiireducens]|uniref:Lysozyme n=1 Tax=Clostridium chromiireducens TaxID=225345 RepID=A0A964W0P7_9CLOT|nr:glycoside hydrolase family protein [Clostridium chromiireducens]MVX62227.1 glycoside hydrolase family protein [Clostridium chromiireducens]
MSNWKWCAIDSTGKIIKGWYKDNEKWYHLNEETGVMDTGWFQDKDSHWYYLDEVNGDMKTGWIQLNEIWYYLEPNSNGYQGSCYINCTATIDGKNYAFDKDGHMIENSCVSDNLFNFIKAFEGCYLKAYYCPSKVLTIGIGNTNPKWTSLGTITEEQALEAFKEDMKVFADGVDNLSINAGVSLNTYQREALISFGFNVGLGALKSSTLWKNICNGAIDPGTITENFARWNKGSGGVLPGLVKRRACEARLYLTGSYSTEI